jgi:glycosyltransferase involved in cell wall biosynthesis
VRVAVNAWFLYQPGTGSGQYLQQLLRALPDLAADLRVLLVMPEGEGQGGGGYQVPGLRVETWRVPATGRRLGKVLFEQIAFPRACERWGADVAHVPYWGSPLRSSVPVVVTVHDLIPLLLDEYRGGPLVRLYARLVSASARRARVVLTDSLSSKRDIERHLGISEDRVRCVYLAVGEGFTPEPGLEDGAIRRLYGLPGDSSSYILYLAGHDTRKNVATLVEAFAVVAQADADATLVIGGSLPERDKPPFYDPRPLVESLGLAEDVVFTGWVDEAHKPVLLRGASCAVFPSRYEGFGLPVLEALACGTPVIASQTSSLPELVGDAGFALDPDDVQGFAGAMLSCLADEGLVEELRRRGPRQATRFSWAEAAERTLAAYEAACLPANPLQPGSRGGA